MEQNPSGQLLPWAVHRWCMRKDFSHHLNIRCYYCSFCCLSGPFIRKGCHPGGEKRFLVDQYAFIIPWFVPWSLLRPETFEKIPRCACHEPWQTGRWMIQTKSWTFGWCMFIAHFAQRHGVCVFNNLPHRTFQAKSANQPLCVLDLVSFFLGSFVTDLRCLNPYWAIWFTIFVVDCMRKDRLPSDVYVDLTCKFGDHGLVSPVRGRLIGGMLNFDSDALIWIRTPIPFVDPSLLPHQEIVECLKTL